MAWPDRRLVVELDGHDASHRTQAAFERDRIRDATLQLMPATACCASRTADLRRDPADVVRAIRALLDRV